MGRGRDKESNKREREVAWDREEENKESDEEGEEEECDSEEKFLDQGVIELSNILPIYMSQL